VPVISGSDLPYRLSFLSNSIDWFPAFLLLREREREMFFYILTLTALAGKRRGKTTKRGEGKSLVGKEKDPRSFPSCSCFLCTLLFPHAFCTFLGWRPSHAPFWLASKGAAASRAREGKNREGGKEEREWEKGFVVVALLLCALSDSRRSIFHTEMNRNAKFANRDASIWFERQSLNTNHLSAYHISWNFALDHNFRSSLNSCEHFSTSHV